MPSGIVYNMEEWSAVAEVVNKTDSWLIHDAAMQRIVFSEAKIIHPASIPSLTERTITIGCVSKEYRMIGWRVGWIVGPKSIMNDIGLVSLSNVVCQVGIAMPGAAAALLAENDGVNDAIVIWQERRDVLLDKLSDLPVVRPDGGWSLLVNTVSIGMTPLEASKLCMEKADIAATPMTGWGLESHAGQYLRFVYANEPVGRLCYVRERLRNAWGL
jgi:aspartate/methionine/tyrosine aminotransferase